MNGLDGIGKIMKEEVDKESRTKVAFLEGVNYTSGFILRNLSDYYPSKSQHPTISVTGVQPLKRPFRHSVLYILHTSTAPAVSSNRRR